MANWILTEQSIWEYALNIIFRVFKSLILCLFLFNKYLNSSKFLTNLILILKHCENCEKKKCEIESLTFVTVIQFGQLRFAVFVIIKMPSDLCNILFHYLLLNSICFPLDYLYWCLFLYFIIFLILRIKITTLIKA